MEGGYWRKETGKRNIERKETRNSKMQEERDWKGGKYNQKTNGKEESTIKKRPERGKYYRKRLTKTKYGKKKAGTRKIQEERYRKKNSR